MRAPRVVVFLLSRGVEPIHRTPCFFSALPRRVAPIANNSTVDARGDGVLMRFSLLAAVAAGGGHDHDLSTNTQLGYAEDRESEREARPLEVRARARTSTAHLDRTPPPPLFLRRDTTFTTARPCQLGPASCKILA